MTRIITVEVLAGAYKGKGADLKALLSHAADEDTMVPLCKKVKPENLTETGIEHEQPTCPTCRMRDPRFPKDKEDGPFILKSLLQFPKA